jgi:uroporphyrinogen decarboxylase
VLERAGGRGGHVFNLGHGILPSTPVDSVKAVVEHVHARTAGLVPVGS